MKRIEVPVMLDIERTAESLHAHAIPEDIDIRPGDRVLVHNAPARVPFGARLQMRTTATVIRANALQRWWTELTGLLEFATLYEVGFERRDTP